MRDEDKSRMRTRQKEAILEKSRSLGYIKNQYRKLGCISLHAANALHLLGRVMLAALYAW